jgi:hypothetical protein
LVSKERGDSVIALFGVVLLSSTCEKGFYLLLNFLKLTEFVAGVETVAEGQLGFLLEHHHVARPSEDEVSEVVSLLDCVPWEH